MTYLTSDIQAIATTKPKCDRSGRPKSNHATITRVLTCDKLSTSDEKQEVAA